MQNNRNLRVCIDGTFGRESKTIWVLRRARLNFIFLGYIFFLIYRKKNLIDSKSSKMFKLYFLWHSKKKFWPSRVYTGPPILSQKLDIDTIYTGIEMSDIKIYLNIKYSRCMQKSIFQNFSAFAHFYCLKKLKIILYLNILL